MYLRARVTREPKEHGRHRVERAAMKAATYAMTRPAAQRAAVGTRALHPRTAPFRPGKARTDTRNLPELPKQTVHQADGRRPRTHAECVNQPTIGRTSPVTAPAPEARCRRTRSVDRHR